MSNLTLFTNVLSSKLIHEIKNDVYKNNFFRSNLTVWGKEIVKSSSPVLIHDFNESLSQKILIELNENIKLNIKEKIFPMYYMWTKLSYIPWHFDQGWEYGLTIYMNEFWDENWGGYFAYRKNNEIKSIAPKFNQAILIKTPIDHTVFMTTTDAPTRETIQIFFKENVYGN